MEEDRDSGEGACTPSSVCQVTDSNVNSVVNDSTAVVGPQHSVGAPQDAADELQPCIINIDALNNPTDSALKQSENTKDYVSTKVSNNVTMQLPTQTLNPAAETFQALDSSLVHMGRIFLTWV